MERNRRQRNQSDEKQSTSLLIQQLAAQRERKLHAGSARASDTRTSNSSVLALPALESEEDEIEEFSATAAGTNAARPAVHGGKTGRGRLIRRDHASSQQQNDEVDELAGMMQGFDLAGKSSSSSAAPRKQPLAMVSLSTHSPDKQTLASSQQQDAERSIAFSTTESRSKSETSAAEDASSSGDEHNAPAAVKTASAVNINSSSEDDDDEPLTYVSRSRRPAAAPPRQQPTVASRHCNAPAAGRSADSGSDDDDDDDGAYSNTSSRSAADVIDVEASESAADDDGSADSTEASEEYDSGSDAAGADSSSGRQQHHQASAAASAAGALVLEGGFCLDAKVASKLYQHQLEGVRWLWSLHRMRKGGILADDMGLGKTMQCSAFLAGALQKSKHTFSSSSSDSTNAIASGAIRALIIAPKTLLAHWEKELRVCGMGPRTHCFYGSSEGERSAALRAVTGRGGVMLTTYGMVLHNAAQLRAGLGTVARDIDEHEDEEDPFTLDPPPGRRILWDYVILDEGHKIKNARTQLAQRLRELRAATRVIISGTPVQNNLAELHALLDFAVPGLLGGVREFKMAYEKPITAGQDRDAGLRVREIGAAKAAQLRKLVGPFMLRREKKEVFGSGSSSETGAVVAAAAAAVGSADGSTDRSSSSNAKSSTAAATSGPAAPAPMGIKHDLVIWLRLQPLQRHIYEAFLHSDAVKAALNSSKSPLAALTVLKKVCDHPALLSERATSLVLSAASKQVKRGKAGSKPQSSKQRRDSLDDFIVDDSDDDEDYRSDSGSDDGYGRGNSNIAAARSRAAVAASLDDAGFTEEFMSWAAAEGLEERLLDGIGQKGPEASCKALFVADLLETLVAAGHRTLVFSQSRVMLDILQAAVVAHGWPYCRIDGSMSSTDARQAQVEKFQAAGSKIPVFLLTTQVGGLGLTLTAADRVVIVDPAWNPATDNQSVDRAYRIGQSRDVVVYRLVTCGTVEEKIYRKQVFKGGLSRAGMEEGVQLRYFTHQELHELFKWDPDALSASETQQLLTTQHKRSSTLASIAPHVDWLESHGLCAGTSEHGLLFSHHDPEGKKLQLEQHMSAAAAAGSQGLSAAAAAAAGRGGYGRAAGGSKGSRAVDATAAAAAGPSAGELSDMLSSLNITAAAAGSSKTTATAAAEQQEKDKQQQQQRRESLMAEVQHLQFQLKRVTTDLATVGARLPDGGSKLKARQEELQRSLEAAQQQLQQMHPQQQQQQSGSATADAAGSTTAAAALVDITNGHDPPEQQLRKLPRPAWLHSSNSSSSGLRNPGAYPPPPPPPPQQQQHLGLVLLNQNTAAAAPAAAAAVHGNSSGFGNSYSSLPPQQQQQLGLELTHQAATATAAAASGLQQQHWQQYSYVPPPPAQQQQWYSQPPPPPRPAQPTQQQQPPSSSSNSSTAVLGAQTLDGRTPTLAELKLRKHVLKKELHNIDTQKAQLRAEGKKLTDEKQQQWMAMFQEYKEIKALLEQQPQAAAAAAGLQAAGKSTNCSSRMVETIDLT